MTAPRLTDRHAFTLPLAACLAALALTLTPACTDDEGADAEAGETGAGEDTTTAGSDTSSEDEDTTGETSAGETSAGETSAGETSAGETTTGETTAGETTAGETGEPDCEGPPNAALAPGGAAQPSDPKAPGATWAHFDLEDFQPQSCNFGESTSLEAFKGRVTLVTLMRSTCEICQGTLEKLEEMRIQLEIEGYDVYFVAINQMGYEDSQQEFIDRVAFPLLQDTAEVDAWELMNETGMGTDDMYIYGADGLLHSYFSYAAGNPSIDLHTPSGWDTVYGAMVSALGG